MNSSLRSFFQKSPEKASAASQAASLGEEALGLTEHWEVVSGPQRFKKVNAATTVTLCRFFSFFFSSPSWLRRTYITGCACVLLDSPRRPLCVCPTAPWFRGDSQKYAQDARLSCRCQNPLFGSCIFTFHIGLRCQLSGTHSSWCSCTYISQPLTQPQVKEWELWVIVWYRIGKAVWRTSECTDLCTDSIPQENTYSLLQISSCPELVETIFRAAKKKWFPPVHRMPEQKYLQFGNISRLESPPSKITTCTICNTLVSRGWHELRLNFNSYLKEGIVVYARIYLRVLFFREWN